MSGIGNAGPGNVGGGNAEAWFNFDAQSETLHAGDPVDHRDAALENLKAARVMTVETVQDIGKSFAGKSVSADNERGVGNPLNYMTNLGAALFMGGLVAPAMVVKDLADAAIHGIVAGFRSIF